MKNAVSTTATFAFTCLLMSHAFAAEPAVPAPATLVVTHQAALGPVSATLLDNAMRWGQALVTRDGALVVFYTDAKRQIVYRRSADGQTFDEPVVVAGGLCPFAAIDESDNVYLACRADDRIVVRKLAAAGPGRWDLSAKPVDVSGQFGDGAAQFPSLLILPSSPRIWCMYGYVPSDLPFKANVGDVRKPKAHPVVTYSDDGGATWAPPRFVGSDSGDTGSGLMALMPYRGQPAWFWTFWDCATPAWGFFDGSLFRGMREFFPHVKNRMAVGHPWDAAEDAAGRLYFATGMHTPGQVARVFDGSAWSPEIWLSARRGTMALLTDGQSVFAASVEGRQVNLSQIAGSSAMPRPDLYVAPEGKTVHRGFTVHGARRTAGYVPLFLVEAVPKQQEGTKVSLTDFSLTLLRLEVKPLEPAAVPSPAAAPGSVVQALPLNDTRIEPRTDPPKDRRIVRVGARWVLVYADDNPGRLMAAELVNGKSGTPVTLIDQPDWNRFQCSAVADGDDTLVAACAGADDVAFVRLTGIEGWDKSPPKAAASTLKLRANWPALCRLPGGTFAAVFAGSRQLTTVISADGKEWSLEDGTGLPTPDARPAFVQCGDNTILVVGGRGGLWSIPFEGGKLVEPRQIAAEQWIGQHFSASSDGDGADVIYAPAESYLGKKIVGHLRFDGNAWKPMPAVDEGHVVEGLNLCSLGAGRLLAVYAIRSDRLESATKEQERLKRFTYAMAQRVFDGKTWSAATPVTMPDIPKYRPDNWKDSNENGGVIYIPETELGRYPALPAAVLSGAKSVPVAWMVPGFHCMPKKERSQIDRGGLLITTEIDIP